MRPGEKLYEELLIDPDNATPTQHSRIFCSIEPKINPTHLATELENMNEALEEQNPEKRVESLLRRVSEYVQHPGLVVNDLPAQGNPSLLN